MYFLDTNILIYTIFPNVDEKKYKNILNLFESAAAGEKKLWINKWVVAEVLWFLARKIAWKDVKSAMLENIFKTKGLEIEERELLFNIINKSNKISDFIDLLNVNLMKESNIKYIYSYDKGFDKHKGIERLTP